MTANQHMLTLTLPQARQLLAKLQGHEWETLFTLALATGMRHGELLGLKWQAIDSVTRTIRVRPLLSQQGQTFEEIVPKTNTSSRSVAIAPFAWRSLERHRQAQKAIKEQAGQAWHDLDLVFCTATGAYLPHNRVTQALQTVRSIADLPAINIHQLRQTTASLLLMLGVPVPVVFAILGLADIHPVVETNTHVSLEMQHEAMRKLHEALVGNSDGDAHAEGSDAHFS